MCPHSGIGIFSHVYIYLEIDDTLFFNKVIQKEIELIDVNNIAGFDFKKDEIIDIGIDSIGTNKRFLLWIQTNLNTVNSILENNTVLDTMRSETYLYKIGTNKTCVNLGSKELYWDFEASKQIE